MTLPGGARLLAHAVSRWADDPFARGGWSLLRVGATPDTRRALGAPIDGRLVIAGEATHPEQAGMTHGAYEQGVGAARWCAAEGHRRVVVVGAGAAGLGAARTLHDGGIEVLVVEARDRIGGRIHTSDLDGTVVELGANWLQQGERNTLAPLAVQQGLSLVPTDFGRPLDVPLDGTPIPADTAAIADGLRAHVETLSVDRSMAAAVAAWIAGGAPWPAEHVRSAVAAEVLLDTGIALDVLSARHGFEPGVGAGDHWVREGYRRILHGLAEGLDVRMGWPVDEVARTAAGVRVRGSAGTVDANAVVVTVPAAVLSEGRPRFVPPLPASHLGALAALATGRVEKVALAFDRRYWPRSPSGYVRILDAGGTRVSEWLDLTDSVGRPLVVGLFAGAWAAELWDGRSDDEVAAGVAAVLARCAPTDAT